MISATIIGSSSAIPRPGRSCSSYLIEDADEDVRLALDLGTGAFASLRRVLVPERLDAVVVTHMHADHFIDLIPLRYALKYGTRTHARRLPVYLPPGGREMLGTLASAFAREPDGDFLEEVYDLRTYDPAGELSFGRGRVRFAPTRHFVPTYAVRYDGGGSSITYSSDTAPCADVVALARDTGLFICEATLPALGDGTSLGHSTAAEAGTMATQAAARRLVISHWPAETSPEELRRLAGATFAGRLDVADDLDRFEPA